MAARARPGRRAKTFPRQPVALAEFQDGEVFEAPARLHGRKEGVQTAVKSSG